MVTHSNTLAWKIPWMEEPGRLKSMGSLSRTRLNNFTFTFHFHALEKEMATHSSVLAWRIPGTGGAWWAAVNGVAQSRTRLKRLSSSSSMYLVVRKVESCFYIVFSRGKTLSDVMVMQIGAFTRQLFYWRRQ